MANATSPDSPLQQEVAQTVQAQGMQTLSDAQELTEKVIETIRDPLLILHPDLRVQTANPAFYRLFQVHPADTLGRRIYELGNGQWAIPELRTLLEDILPHHTVFNDFEVSHTFPQLGPRTMLLNARHVDHLQLILLAMEDITSRKHAETLLRAHAELLRTQVVDQTAALEEALDHLRREMAARQRFEREAQRAQHFALLGRLAAGVSHEIRNPLGAVVLHIDLLEEELRQPSPNSAAEVAQTLAEIRTQLVRLEDLVQDHLSLVHVRQLARTPQDLGVALQTWATGWQNLAAARGVTLQVEGVATLGQVAFHPNTLHRVLLNLVQNALDAMGPGGTLTIRGQATATQVQLHVQDTGVGIPATQRVRIFEPLYTTKPGGTGLGLYIVHEIVAAHAGHVTVESEEGQGTTFTLTLPLTAEDTPQGEQGGVPASAHRGSRRAVPSPSDNRRA
jgi:two-component system, chemotaxis family, CheB/CheR fusion protein